MKKCLLLFLATSVLLLSGCQRSLPRPSPTAALKTINVLYGESTSDPGLEDIFTEHLTKQFPDVLLDWESVDWGERFSSTLQAKIASGEVPDLIIGKAQDVRAFEPTGNLAAISESLASHIQPFGLERVSVDGATYGLPYNMLYQGVLYNKNIFYRYGLQVPETMEELHQVVDRLEEMGVVPFGTHFQEVWYTGNILMQFAANEVFLSEPDWGERFRQGQASYTDSLAWRHCYEQAQYVLAHSWPDATSISQHEADMRFAAEDCAMYLTGSWSIQTLLTIAPQRKLGIFPYPNREGNAKLLYEPNITFMMSAKTSESALIEQLLLSIIEDQELGQQVCQFTQTDSMLIDMQPSALQIIRESVDQYKAQDGMLDVTVGNSQLIWQYQYNCAEAALAWLKGQGTLEEALLYADEHRLESGAEGNND